MLLRRAGEIRATGRRGATRPDERSTRLDVRREELILEVGGLQLDAGGELAHADRFVEVAGERLLAGDAEQRPLPRFDRRDDLLDVLDARVVGAADPERLDVRIGDHLRDAAVGLARTDVEIPGERRDALGALAAGAPDAEDVGIADADERLYMEAGDESASNEANAESFRHPVG